MNKVITGMIFVVFSTAAHSHNISIEECLEGSDFIKNAALLRDSGREEGNKEAFIGQMISDIERIQQFPPELRWFVQDENDGEFLLQQANIVWDTPQSPEQHQQDFLNSCINR